MDITDRQIEILNQIVEEYAETATPVGSVTMARLFDVSPATIRAEMAKLERLGLIAQPHTSAGRVPTDAGYRFYVNELAAAEEYEKAKYAEAADYFKFASGAASFRYSHDPENDEDISEIDMASSIRADIDDEGVGGFPYSGEIDFVTRFNPAEIFRRIPPEFRLGSGIEEKKPNNKPKNKNKSSSKKFDNVKSDFKRDTHVLEVRIGAQSCVDAAIRMAANTLVELTGNLSLATIGEQLYLSGLTRLFTQPEFTHNIARVQSVARLLDNLEPWLREASPCEPLNIFIGKENPVGKNSDVSLIIAKFCSPYSDRSYIGVLGPTRQNYSRVMRLVREAGEALEDTIADILCGEKRDGGTR